MSCTMDTLNSTSSTYSEQHCDLSKQILNLKNALDTDIDACDMKWTLFVAAAQSYRFDSRLTPYPPKYANDDKFDIDAVLHVIVKVPPLMILLHNIKQNKHNDLDIDVIELLHWVLVTVEDPNLRSVPKKQFKDVLQKVISVIPGAEPTHIFKAIPKTNSIAEIKFQLHANNRNTIYGFHGSKLYNFHSILHHGLQQHLSKVALFGDGIYLSSEMHVSLSFSPLGRGWGASRCGKELTCMALCEFVEHPVHLKSLLTDPRNNSIVPDKYFVITNNEIIRLRYLIVYGKTRTEPMTYRNPTMNWIMNNKSIVTMCFYVFALVSIGVANSRDGLYFRHIIWRKTLSFLEHLKQFYFKL